MYGPRYPRVFAALPEGNMLKLLEGIPVLGTYVVKPLFTGVNYLIDGAQAVLFFAF